MEIKTYRKKERKKRDRQKDRKNERKTERKKERRLAVMGEGSFGMVTVTVTPLHH